MQAVRMDVERCIAATFWTPGQINQNVHLPGRHVSVKGGLIYNYCKILNSTFKGTDTCNVHCLIFYKYLESVGTCNLQEKLAFVCYYYYFYNQWLL